ncbi:PriCT-2 domain-containing protein [Citrifermentans bremense]|uniref:PriCT-2 domain-containing protein n=1 Tax=Citrifermentans bremense TaxID=60035 RepID=UPI0003FFD68E|nr:PriCT-2 domain-containing protein [Citrifermentans bremense]
MQESPRSHPTALSDCRTAAFFWYGFGLKVMPVIPGNKASALKWDPWLQDLNPEKINEHWTIHPEHELGGIVGNDLIVFDADGPESLAALVAIEAAFGIEPKLVVGTRKGQHHYFRRTLSTVARSDSHCSEKFPDRLDIKTGRALIVLPPSTGKSVLKNLATAKNDLTEATQEFVDAVYKHNGRPVPSASTPEGHKADAVEGAASVTLEKISAVINEIDPDSGYDDWLRVGMAVYHETGGNNDGLELYNAWSKAGKKYKNWQEIEAKWRSFRSEVATPVTIGTLIKMARDNGANVETGSINCSLNKMRLNAGNSAIYDSYRNPLDKYSLLGMSTDIERGVREQVPILGGIALIGQSTVIYAAPNTGKTLICFHLLMASLHEGLIEPSKVYYVNVDDTSTGLLEKLKIAEEYGFHMLAEGYRDFKANELVKNIIDMTETDNANGVVIFLDTLKKFTNLMDKNESSKFTKIVRNFILKGGTIIALAHTNKNPGPNGAKIPTGTSDIIDDLDCAYVLDTVSINSDTSEKTVEFKNKKSRGGVPMSKSYSYTAEKTTSYNELLCSVKEISISRLEDLKQEMAILSDAEMILAIATCITNGIDSKMLLAAEAAKRTKCSKKHALRIIEQYTGEDPTAHRWAYEVRERGAKVFRLLHAQSAPAGFTAPNCIEVGGAVF